MSRANEQIARERAEWLHAHNAPKDWIVMTAQEVAGLKAELAALTEATAERDRDIARLADAAEEVLGCYNLEKRIQGHPCPECMVRCSALRAAIDDARQQTAHS